MRLLAAAAVLVAVGLVLGLIRMTSHSGAKIDPRAGRLAEVRKRFDDEVNYWQRMLASAGGGTEMTHEGRVAIGQQAGLRVSRDNALKELLPTTTAAALEIAREAPGDDIAFEAIGFLFEACHRCGMSCKEIEAAYTILADHHVRNPRLKEVLPTSTRNSPAADRLLRLASEPGIPDEIRATAMFYRVRSIAEGVEITQDSELIIKSIRLLEEATETAPNAKVLRHGVTDTVSNHASKDIATLKAWQRLLPGQPAPDGEGVDLAGTRLKLSSYKGKVVLLHFWMARLPIGDPQHLQDIVAKQTDKPFVLINISADEEKQDLEYFITRRAVPGTHWWDNGRQNQFLKTYLINSFPTFYLIDHKGMIRYRWFGKPGKDVLDRAAAALLAEAEAEGK